MRYIIITGAARGLGKAFAENLSKKETTLFLIDKRDLSETKKACEKKGAAVFDSLLDLTKTEEITPLFDTIFSKIDTDTASTLDLINNAAAVLPLGLMGLPQNNEIDYEITTDFTAYVLTTNEFIRRTQERNVTKRIINISSGAAVKTIKGAAVYCGCKAAVDMFTKTVGKEQSKKEHPIHIVSVTPGVIDTEMQVDLRSAPKDAFPPKNQFAAMKKLGVLQPAESTAQKICSLYERKKFPSGEVLSYRNI
ncbi:SDR family NAD(P)-dependent oxidoreductase [Patescibacteria group bacterium]|nr:SDR family NAD(P)-dependent oxidoreductase [Patescibacteria group bacterium]